jgi:hypothetical protein
VPLYALIQLRSAPGAAGADHRREQHPECAVHGLRRAGRRRLLGNGISIPALFGIAALCNAVVAIYIYSLVPEFMLRFIAWLLVHSVYRLQQKGLENIPQEGPAVLVCNHVSFVDPIVIAAASRRPIRFVMDYRIYRTPLINFRLSPHERHPDRPGAGKTRR